MRVIIAEDLFLLRQGLIRLLEDYDFQILTAVDNGPELVNALLTLKPDVAVVDVRLHPSFTDEGLRAAIEARRQIPGLPVLVLSQHVEELYARELLADGNGGIGYLLKDRVLDAEQFIDTVHRVAAGGTAIDPQVISRLLTHRTDDTPVAKLTTREREVLKLMAEGWSNTAIAERLVLSERAISKHTSNIFGKLRLTPSDDVNRRVLAVLAYLDHP
jgi:DNA-binding NarL/FixJ family response regulator